METNSDHRHLPWNLEPVGREKEQNFFSVACEWEVQSKQEQSKSLLLSLSRDSVSSSRATRVVRVLVRVLRVRYRTVPSFRPVTTVQYRTVLRHSADPDAMQ